ncbi:MAG TPA: hypothetical protein VIJ15_12010 [Dermatophilaceae bacterium]
MSERQLVLSFFADQAAAAGAATDLQESSLASKDAIGILVLDANGELNVDKVGARSTAAGAGIGACLLVLGPAALGVGIIGGTVGGALHHKGLKLTDEDKARITTELQGGKAAVGVLAKVEDAGTVQAHLTALGGATSTHAVVDEHALAASTTV